VEKYLRQCLDSVVNQTLDEIEILCVNDGSTDTSKQILEEYSRKDERIKIINQKNKGAAAARKVGLDNAKGDFIAFVDSDDWVKLDTYEKLYKNAITNNSDLVLLNFIMYDESKQGYVNWLGLNITDHLDKNTDFNIFTFDYSEVKPLLLNGFTGCTNKLYKTSFLRSYDDFYFPDHITLGEDVPLNVQVLLRARKISFCNENLYIYRLSNANSSSNTSIKNKKIFEIFTIIDEVENILIENRVMDGYKTEFFIFQIVHLAHWFKRCDKSFKQQFFETMKKYFNKIDFQDNEIYKLNLPIKNNYENVLSSKTYTEFELKSKKDLLKLTYDNKLKQQKQDYEKKLNHQKIEYENKLKLKENIIKEMNSSNSWKLTKPLREIGIQIKRLK